MLRSATELALALVLCAFCIEPWRMARWSRCCRDNTRTVNRLRYMLENTAPTDSVMDGWSGLGVFRPHAYFYWFLHAEILAMLDDEQRAQLLNDLESGKVAPHWIIVDGYMTHLSPGITEFIVANYHRVIAGYPMWERNDGS